MEMTRTKRRRDVRASSPPWGNIIQFVQCNTTTRKKRFVYASLVSPVQPLEGRGAR
jgi:hypothetical protein